MTISLPISTEKQELEREHPILTKFVPILNSCFIQYNAPLERYVNVAPEKLVSKVVFRIVSI